MLKRIFLLIFSTFQIIAGTSWAADYTNDGQMPDAGYGGAQRALETGTAAMDGAVAESKPAADSPQPFASEATPPQSETDILVEQFRRALDNLDTQDYWNLDIQGPDQKLIVPKKPDPVQQASTGTTDALNPIGTEPKPLVDDVFKLGPDLWTEVPDPGLAETNAPDDADD